MCAHAQCCEDAAQKARHVTFPRKNEIADGDPVRGVRGSQQPSRRRPGDGGLLPPQGLGDWCRRAAASHRARAYDAPAHVMATAAVVGGGVGVRGGRRRKQWRQAGRGCTCVGGALFCSQHLKRTSNICVEGGVVEGGEGMWSRFLGNRLLSALFAYEEDGGGGGDYFFNILITQCVV